MKNECLPQLNNEHIRYGTSLGVTSLANNAYTNIRSIQLEPGTYFINGSLRFNAGTGLRSLSLSTTSAATTNSRMNIGDANNQTTMEINMFFTISATSTVYLVARQTSGGSLGIDRDIMTCYKLY